MNGKCVICGKNNGLYYDGRQIYLERGISKKECICVACHEKKMLVRNYGGNEKKRILACEYFEKKIANKSNTIQNIVKAWINGEEQNYFSSAEAPVYYVECVEDYLFVFEDHITILSTYSDSSYGSHYGMRDYVYFYRCNAKVSPRKVGEVKGLFINVDWDDCKAIDAGVDTEKIKEYSKSDIRLHNAVAEYGTLEFDYEVDYRGNKLAIRYYSHQNQLMEEIYNYIQSKMDNSDVETKASTVDKSPIAEKQSEKKTDSEGTNYSPADEIKKMKELFDCGILSQEEFDEAKKRLISKL